jgi:2'-5' RNA ligase
MHRLFVAIRPPAPIRALLLAVMGGIGGARWQNDGQLHLTLRFLGDVDRHLAGDIHAALGTVHQTPFEIALSGLGLFDNRGFPDTVWAGVAPHDPLTALHKKIDAALRRVGIPPDPRAFLPHITLARLNRTAGPVAPMIEAHGGLTSPMFTAHSFGLFESDLTADGAVYTLIERYALS